MINHQVTRNRPLLFDQNNQKGHLWPLLFSSNQQWIQARARTSSQGCRFATCEKIRTRGFLGIRIFSGNHPNTQEKPPVVERTMVEGNGKNKSTPEMVCAVCRKWLRVKIIPQVAFGIKRKTCLALGSRRATGSPAQRPVSS